MARTKPTPASFKKGDPRASAAGKKSSRALPSDLKEARSQFAKEFEDTIYKYMFTSIKDLKTVLKDPETHAKDAVVLSVLVNAVEKGDNVRLNFLLERTIGKVKDVQDVNVKSMHKTLVDLLSEDDDDL